MKKQRDYTSLGLLALAVGISLALLVAYGGGKQTPVITQTHAALSEPVEVRKALAVEPTPQPNDCVVIATETMRRLQREGAWAEVIAFDFVFPDGEFGRHAVCLFQPVLGGSLFVYDGKYGTVDLQVKSADLRVVEWAFNKMLEEQNAGFIIENLQVMAQPAEKPRAAMRATLVATASAEDQATIYIYRLSGLVGDNRGLCSSMAGCSVRTVKERSL
jgi:hypothetical protein